MVRERAILVGVEASKNKETFWGIDDSIDELAQLAKTAGVAVIGKVLQKLPVPNKTFYIGKGKLEEIKTLKLKSSFETIIFDDELTPLQQRNLEEELEVKVIDRAALILDIFADHARTSEGILQVELAQHQYLLPRLAGQWSHLERLGGGIGTRGPGESQLETDRRLIGKKIHNLKKKLEEVKKHRRLYRIRRSKKEVPVMALVGYTNSGKSSLLNALCNAEVLQEDKLFATLDPTTRKLIMPDGEAVLLSDTVGFIRKLPPTIISAFRATLEELEDADILVNVVDISLHNSADQCQIVENILKEMNLDQKPRITVMNKIDKLLGKEKNWDEQEALDFIMMETGLMQGDMVFTSALKEFGLESLKGAMSRTINKYRGSVIKN